MEFDYRNSQLLLLYLALDAFFPPTTAAEDASAGAGEASPERIVAAFNAYTSVSPTLSKVCLDPKLLTRTRLTTRCAITNTGTRTLLSFSLAPLSKVLLALWQLDAATPIAQRVPRAVRCGVCVDASHAVRLLAHPGVSTLDPPELMYIALRQLLCVDASAALLFARQLSVAQLVSVVDQGTLQRDASLPRLAILARLACAAGSDDSGGAAQRDSLLCEAMELLQRASRALQQPPAPAAGASAVLLATVLSWMDAEPARFCKLAQFHFQRLASPGNFAGGGGDGASSAGLSEGDLVAQLAAWSIARAQPQLMDVAVSYFLQTHKPAVALALHRWHVWAVLQTLPSDEAVPGGGAGGGAGGASTAPVSARLGAAQARTFGQCALVRAHLIHASLAQLPASMRDARRALPVSALPLLDGTDEFATSGVADDGADADADAGRGCVVYATHADFLDMMRLWCEYRCAKGWQTRLATVVEELVAALRTSKLSVEARRATGRGKPIVEVWRRDARGPSPAAAGGAAVAQLWTLTNFLDYAPVRAACCVLRAARRWSHVHSARSAHPTVLLECILCTVTCSANPANDLTSPPSFIVI